MKLSTMNTIEKPVVESLLKFLNKVYGAVGEIKESENGSVEYLYLQDAVMKDIFNFYPERICIDCTIKRFEIDIFITTFCCEDSNGRSHIIGLGFLHRNDGESFTWLLETFKKHNPNWRKIQFVAIDQKIQLRNLVKDLFLQPLIITCFFHLSKIFKNDINNFKSLSDEQKESTIELFKKIFHASSHSEWLLLAQEYGHLPVVHQWLEKQEEWRMRLDFRHENVFENLNTFLEEINYCINAVFVTEKNLMEFIKKLFLIISLKKKEKPGTFLQPVSFLYSRFSPEYQISKALTPYAAKFVIQQLDLSSEISYENKTFSDTHDFLYMNKFVKASTSACSCYFYSLTMLPCRHTFAVRKANFLCTFDESLVDYAWNMKYYQHTLTCMQGYLHQSTESRIPQDIVSRTTLSSHLFEISVPQLIDLPKEVYESRIELLKKLVQAWKMDDDVSLHFIGVEKCIEPVGEVKLFDPSVPGPSNVCCGGSKYAISNLNAQLELSRNNDSSTKKEKRGLCNFKTGILRSNQINFAYICCVLCINKESCIEWLRKMGFFASSMRCPSCNSEMIIKSISRLLDGFVWACPKTGENRKCNSKRCSIRLGSWFEQTNMTLEQILLFTYMWVRKFTQPQIVFELGISSSNYMLLNKFLLRVCEESLDKEEEDATNCTSPLDRWHERHVREDYFIQFLKEAASLYQRDAARNKS